MPRRQGRRIKTRKFFNSQRPVSLDAVREPFEVVGLDLSDDDALVRRVFSLRILPLDIQYTINYDETTFDELNKVMRGLGFTGTKGAYELRKICIDHVYQKFGAEMAVSISGDNINTIIHYYADPSQPNLDEILISELL